MDLEDTGLLDTEQVGEVLEQLGVVVSPAQLEKMVAEYGVDGSGLVQVEDFVRTLDPVILDHVNPRTCDPRSYDPRLCLTVS